MSIDCLYRVRFETAYSKSTTASTMCLAAALARSHLVGCIDFTTPQRFKCTRGYSAPQSRSRERKRRCDDEPARNRRSSSRAQSIRRTVRTSSLTYSAPRHRPLGAPVASRGASLVAMLNWPASRRSPRAQGTRRAARSAKRNPHTSRFSYVGRSQPAARAAHRIAPTLRW